MSISKDTILYSVHRHTDNGVVVDQCEFDKETAEERLETLIRQYRSAFPSSQIPDDKIAVMQATVLTPEDAEKELKVVTPLLKLLLTWELREEYYP